MPKCLPEFGDAKSEVTATDDEAFSHLNEGVYEYGSDCLCGVILAEPTRIVL